jgi:hypothetical protein
VPSEYILGLNMPDCSHVRRALLVSEFEDDSIGTAGEAGAKAGTGTELEVDLAGAIGRCPGTTRGGGWVGESGAGTIGASGLSSGAARGSERVEPTGARTCVLVQQLKSYLPPFLRRKPAQVEVLSTTARSSESTD